MSGMGEEYQLFLLCQTPGIGAVRIRRLLQRAGTPGHLFGMDKKEIRRLGVLGEKEIAAFFSEETREQADRVWNAMGGQGIHFLTERSDCYPEKLRTIPDPPFQLYWKGGLPDGGKVSVGIVGARDCSFYGRDMARVFGYRLAQAGVQVISGMARGVDGWSHQGALESGGKTYAVFGSGVDVCYPATHRRLYESILARGGVLSEYSPGTEARAQFFPMRNRLISGLSDGILVVEAREKSGSFITVEAALEQGKDVFAIPGRIGDALSAGCNRLIAQGAVPVLSPDDILEYYGVGKEKVLSRESGCGDGVEEKIMEKLSGGPVHTDAISAGLGLSPTDVCKSLAALRKEGKVREAPRGFWRMV